MIKNPPFHRTKLDDEQIEGDWVNVRLNKLERTLLEEIKEDFNIKADARALKLSAFIGRNVTQSLFSRKMLQYLFKKDRQRLEDYQ